MERFKLSGRSNLYSQELWWVTGTTNFILLHFEPNRVQLFSKDQAEDWWKDMNKNQDFEPIWYPLSGVEEPRK